MSKSNTTKSASKQTLNSEKNKIEKNLSLIVNEVNSHEQTKNKAQRLIGEIAEKYIPLLQSGGIEVIEKMQQETKDAIEKVDVLKSKIAAKNVEALTLQEQILAINEQLNKYEQDEVTREINGLLGTRNFRDQPNAIREIQTRIAALEQEIARLKSGA